MSNKGTTIYEGVSSELLKILLPVYYYRQEMLGFTMAGKGGKQSHRKGYPKNKSDTINRTTDVSQTSNIHSDGPRSPSDLNPNVVANFELPTSESSFTEGELERLLYVKLDLLYTKAQDQLLKSGYSIAEIESASMHAGSVRGKSDFLNNVCENIIAYIEKKTKPSQNHVGLYTCALDTMVDSVGETRRKHLWHLLAKNWGFVPSTIIPSQQRSRDKSSIWFQDSYVNRSLNQNEDICSSNPSSVEIVPSEMQTNSSSKKVGLLERINFTVASLSRLRLAILIHTDAVQKKIGDPVIRLQAFPCGSSKPTEVPNIVMPDFLRSLTDCSYGACLKGCLEGDSDDPKAALIVDLVKNIRELHEKVNKQKEWAQKKMIASARKISKDFLELKMLRMEEFDRELNKQEIEYIEKSCILMLIDAEQGLQKANNASMILNNSVKKLARENSKMTADIQGLKLDVSEYEKELGEVLKRERRGLRKLADVEKQTGIMQSQLEKEKQRVTLLEIELLEAEKGIFEAEMEWRHKTTEKDHMNAVLAEEMKKVKIQKANSRAKLLKIQQKVDIDRQLARDDLRRLENELKCLRIAHEMPDTFLENESFWCDNAESSGLNESSKEAIRHRICMMCVQNEVSVVFLPCTHQVVCARCYSDDFRTEGGCCPCCHVEIERSIQAYGASS